MKLPFLNKRITPLIPITIFIFFLLISIAIVIPPSAEVPFFAWSFSIVYLALFLLFLFFFGVGTLIFKTRFNGMLLGLFIIAVLLLRLNDLKHPIFFVILAALFITVEFFFSQSNKNTDSLKKIEPTQLGHQARKDHSPRTRRK